MHESSPSFIFWLRKSSRDIALERERLEITYEVIVLEVFSCTLENVNRIGGILMSISKPNERGFRAAIDICHQGNLLSSLMNVLLVDAQSIHPKQESQVW